MNVISFYSGYVNASTGVASVIKSLDQGSWSEYSLDHSVFSFDQKGSTHKERKEIAGDVKVSKINTLKRQCLNLFSLFRLWLWRSAVTSVFSALFYFKLFHQFRARRLVTAFNAGAYDDSCLIVHDIWSLIALARSGYSMKNVLFVIHGSDDPISFMLDIFPKLSATKFIIRLKSEFVFCLTNVKAVIVLSEDNLEKIRTQYGVETQLILNGIPDIEVDAKPPSGLNINITGSLCARKRQYLLIDAIAKLGTDFLNVNNVKVNCFGGGPDQSKLKILIEKYDLDKWVVLHGDTHAPYSNYGAGDIILCISTEEGLPVALIEGLRSGCVPVVTDVGGCKLTIANNNGLLLLKKNDESLLAELVSAFQDISDINKRAELAAKSLSLFHSSFSNTKMVRAYAKVICA